MRLLRFIVLFSLIPLVAFAQRGGGGGGMRGGGGGGMRGGGGGGMRGGGGGGMRGGGGGGMRGGGGGFRGGYGGGGFRGGFRGYGRGSYYGPGFGYGFGGYWGYPYSYDPYYYGSSYYGYGAGYASYYPSYDYGYVSSPAYVSAPPASAPVVIEQNVQSSAPPGGSFYRQADFYLIAFDDHTIQAALSFRVEGDQIYWVTREHVERRAPLASVDRRFSEQINRDRRVEFRLP